MVYKVRPRVYIFADYDERSGQYTQPMTVYQRRITGCHTISARSLDGLVRHGRTYASSSAAHRAELAADMDD